MSTVARAFQLYKLFGSANYIGEAISQLEHATQVALLAEKDMQSHSVIIAGFLHDIGHLVKLRDPDAQMGNVGVKSHEKVGAFYLRECGFPEDVCNLVENHVSAKRYLSAKYPNYINQLSPASIESLRQQGGPMTFTEVLQFETDPLLDMYIKLREYDDKAKDDNPEVLNNIHLMNPVNYYYNMAITNLHFTRDDICNYKL